MTAFERFVVVFFSDVLEGVRRVSHNALAMLGLVAVVGVLFLMGRADVRYTLETQALSWLMERANLRASASPDAEGDDGELLAMAEPEAIQRATAANPAELSRQQANVAYWIARRYNVAPEPISRLVQEAWTVGHHMNLEPTLVLAVMATESNFDPLAVSPKNAQGLMQLVPDTAARFNVRQITDPVQNIRGGMAYLRWLMAYFEGDIALVAAAYNAGERAVERYLGVPP